MKDKGRTTDKVWDAIDSFWFDQVESADCASSIHSKYRHKAGSGGRELKGGYFGQSLGAMTPANG